MKKLMFAAAVAATGMTFAASYEAQVYDVCLSIKTTEAASAKLSSKDNIFLSNTDKENVVYRKQASKSWKGLIWGCDCEAIDGVWEGVNQIGETRYKSVKGCVIWDTKTKKPVYFGSGSNLGDLDTVPGTGFGWDFINAIDKNGKKCEGAWTMLQNGDICEDTEWEEEDAELFKFQGAGFGTLCLMTEKDDDGNQSLLCTSYIKSISGNFAGYMKAPYKVKDTDWSGCTFCGYDPIVGSCDPAEAWDYCECGDTDFFVPEMTAAYGTWSVKYNSSLSKKLSKTPAIKEGLQSLVISIRQVYNFPEAVAAGILAVEEKIWDDPEPTEECVALEAAMNSAKTALDDANKILDGYEEDVAYLSDKAAVEADYDKACDVAYIALTNMYAKERIYNTTNNAYAQYKTEQYEPAIFAETNVHATITYKNNSGDPTPANVIGCAAITAKVNELKNFTLVKMESYVPGVFGSEKTCTTWDACNKLVKEYTDDTVAKAKGLATLKTDADAAKAEYDEAKEDSEEKVEAREAAYVVKENRVVLLATAEAKVASQEVIVSTKESEYNTAKARYVAAGCAE